MRKFASKLFLLQNLENEELLIHKRIDAQIWGPAGVCLWTKHQRKIIDEAKTAFINGDQINWIVTGSFGTGKTLVMMQLARDFVNMNPVGDVVICLPFYFSTNLTEQLKSCVGLEDFFESGRLKIIDVLTWRRVQMDPNIKLALFDESNWPEKRQAKRGFSLVVFLSSAKYVEKMPYEAEKVFSLGNGNLRSSAHITEFIADFHAHVKLRMEFELARLNKPELHSDSESLEIAMLVMGHSLIRSLVGSHRSLARSLARSLTRS